MKVVVIVLGRVIVVEIVNGSSYSTRESDNIVGIVKVDSEGSR